MINFNNSKRNGKKDFTKIVTWMLFSIIFISFIVICGIKMKKSFEVLDELHEIETELVEMAQFNYFGTHYECVERPEFMVELFPYGETDNDMYQSDGIRMIKITWYNSKRTKVESEEYKIIPSPEYMQRVISN